MARQDENTAVRFGSVDFATEELSSSESSEVRAAASKYADGRIASIFVEATSGSEPIVRWALCSLATP